MKKRFKRIYVEITNICNLQCSFCPPSGRAAEVMTPEIFGLVLNEIRAWTDHIYLHLRGEPLMHPQLAEILGAASANGLQVNITTNGTWLDAAMPVLLQHPPRQLNVSMHSLQQAEEADGLLRAVRRLETEGKTWISLRFWDGAGADDPIVRRVKRWYGAEAQPLPVAGRSVKLSAMTFLHRELPFEWPDMQQPERSPTGRCQGMKDHLGILADGTVVPCCLDHTGAISLGNLKEDTLEAILTSSRAMCFIREMGRGVLSESLCRRCSYRERFERTSF